MKKTALQQAIEEIERRRDSYAKIPCHWNGVAVRDECIRSLTEAVTILTMLKPTERKQHEDSYNESVNNEFENFGDYFANTYEHE